MRTIRSGGNILNKYLNKVTCADCLDVLKELPDKCVDLVLTDPPYNVGREYHGTYNDNRSDYKEWCMEWFSELLRVSKYSVVFSIGTKNLAMWYEIQPPNWIYIWWKGNNMGSGSKYTNIGRYEPFLMYGELKDRLPCDGRVVPIAIDKNLSGLHDCPKQIKIIEHLVNDFSDEGDIILDCFLGSGTTAIACIKTGRQFIGVELSQKYCDIANKRIQDELDQFKLAL